MSAKKTKERMIKTSIDLTAEHYHFLKLKALDRKMKGQDPSFVTILRELIEEDRKQWKSIPKLLAVIIVWAFLTPLNAHAITQNSSNQQYSNNADGYTNRALAYVKLNNLTDAISWFLPLF